jgi:uncharacterized protein involved in exopolysaccharide biosynthesis
MDAIHVPHEAPPSLQEFVCHLHAHRHAALRSFLAVFLAALVVAALLRPSYRATATLAVLPAPEFTVRTAAGSHDPNTSALAMDQIMKAETAILDSDDLHEATLHRVGEATVYPRLFAPAPPKLAVRLLQGTMNTLLSPWRVRPADRAAALQQRALRQFESDLDLLPTKDANVITVSFDNADGEAAAQVVNTMLALYAARRTHLYEDPQEAVVRKAVAGAESAAAAADRALADYKRLTGISDYVQQRDLLLHRLTEAGQNASEAEALRAEQLARVTALGQQLRGEPATVPIYHEDDPDTRLQAANAALLDLRAKLAAAREKFLDGSRVVTMLTAQIGAQEAEASRLGHDPAASVVRKGRNTNLELLRLDRARAAGDLAAAAAQFFARQTEVSGLQAALDHLDGAEVRLVDLQRRAQAADDDFRTASRILAERHLTEAEDALRLANVRVIQPALVPQKPRPVPLLVIAAGFVFGGIAALARVVAAFVLRPVFLTGEGLEYASGIPVLAVFRRGAERSEDLMEV